MNAPIVTDVPLRGQARHDELTGPWFDALAEGRLTLRRCASCGHHARPDAATCPACHSDVLDWSASTGSGTVVGRIVDHTGEGILHLGLVELDEGPWLHARLLGNPAVGDPVDLVVLAAEDTEPIPAFCGRASARTQSPPDVAESR